MEARVTAEQKELIERAAAYEGRSLADSVVTRVQQAASSVIREHELMRLNASESKAFVEALLNPPEANQALRSAAEAFRQDVVSQ